MTSTPSHQALYRRWRSQRFGDVVGQEAVVATLRNAVASGRSAHAYLFVGPRGTGKTSLARILAKAVNCPNVDAGEPCDACPSCDAVREGRALDVVELDAASNNRVDDIRELLPRIYTAPADLPTKVFIVDEVQRITQGWDVLLKTLEEPPPHVVFIFCTTDPSGIRPAVVSRVQRFDFRPLALPLIEGKLLRILAADGRTAEPEAVELIARLANGGMRDAESILDQLLSAGGEHLTADGVRDLLGLADAETVATFGRALATGDVTAGIGVLDALEDRGRDLRSFADQVVEALRSALHDALAGRASDDGLAGLGVAALALAARRIAAIDPARPGPGGIRLALELATFEAADAAHMSAASDLAALTPARNAPAAPVAAAAAASMPALAPVRDPSTAAPGAASAGRSDAQPPPSPSPGTSSAPAAVEQPAPAARRDAARRSPQEPTVSPAAVSPSGSDDARPAPAFAAFTAAVSPSGPNEAERPAGTAPGPPAPADAPPADAPPADAPPADAALVEIRERWVEIVALISRHPPTKPLIEACRPIAVDGAIVTLGFPESQLFLRDVADRRRSTLEDGLGRVLGRPVSVRCVATNLEPEPPPADAEGAAVLQAARDVWGDDLVEIPEVR